LINKIENSNFLSYQALLSNELKIDEENKVSNKKFKISEEFSGNQVVQ